MNTRALADQLIDPSLPAGARAEAARRLGLEQDPTVLWSLAAALDLSPLVEPVQSACLAAIKKMDGVALLLDFLEQGDPEEQVRAAAALRHFPRVDVALRLVPVMTDSVDSTIRAYCAEGIARSDNPLALRALVSRQEDDDPRMRRWAARGAARLDDGEAAEVAAVHGERSAAPGTETPSRGPASKNKE